MAVPKVSVLERVDLYCNISLTVWIINCFCSIYINRRSWVLLYISTKLKLAKNNLVIQTIVSTIKWIIAIQRGKFLLKSLLFGRGPNRIMETACFDANVQ